MVEEQGRESKEETGREEEKTAREEGIKEKLFFSTRGNSRTRSLKQQDIKPQQIKVKTGSPIKEDMMPLDEEGKRFITEEVKTQIGPVKEKLSVLDDVKTGMDTLREAVEKINTTTPPPPQVKIPTAQELIEGTKEAIKSEEDERRKRLENDQRTKDRDEKLNKVYNYCYSNPESAECKTLPDYLKKQLEEALKKTPQGTEEKKPEASPGLGPLEPMTEEKRKTQTDEQNKTRDGQVAEIDKAMNITSNDRYRQMDETDKDKIADKSEMRERFIKSQTPDELAKAVAIQCTDEACQVKFREGGYAVFKLDKKDNRWKAVDKEVAKDMTPLF